MKKTDNPDLMSTNDVAALLGKHIGTITMWRKNGRGPHFSLNDAPLRPRATYKREDVEKWMRDRENK